MLFLAQAKEEQIREANSNRQSELNSQVNLQESEQSIRRSDVVVPEVEIVSVLPEEQRQNISLSFNENQVRNQNGN